MQSKIMWALLLGCCAVLLLGAVVGALVGGSGEASEAKPAIPKVRKVQPAMPEAAMRKQLEEAEEYLATYVPPDPEQQVLEVVAGHLAQVEEAPDSPEAPALLQAVGNLYHLRLQDYDMAAKYYRMALDRYPDDPGRFSIYPELVTVYEKAGDQERVMLTYMEMMQVFPPESVEYQFAADKLRLQPHEGPEVIHPGTPEEEEFIRQREAARAAADAEAAAEAAAAEAAAAEGEDAGGE